MVMSVSIADGPLETRAREATVELLAHAAAAWKQALESAAPPPKPKLDRIPVPTMVHQCDACSSSRSVSIA